jgi:hypothetical protein
MYLIMLTLAHNVVDCSQARQIQQEATEQTHLLKDIDDDMSNTVASIEGSTAQAHMVNTQSRKSYCWMYVVICVELYVLLTILIKY